MKIFKWMTSLLKRKDGGANACAMSQVSDDDYTRPDAFVRTWSLVDFAKKHGKMQLGKFPAFNNRESFLMCRFVDCNNKYVYASVSSQMQGITVDEIREGKDRIRVGQLPNGKYVLYDFRFKSWEEVAL